LRERIINAPEISSDAWPAHKGAIEAAFGSECRYGQIIKTYVERQNLNMRMGMRRFTRLTNAFSEKIENHCHSLALHFLYYNFVRIHRTLKVSPAMAAGVSGRLWSVEDIVTLIEARDARKREALQKER
jgi:hypothetical protein